MSADKADGPSSRPSPPREGQSFFHRLGGIFKPRNGSSLREGLPSMNMPAKGLAQLLSWRPRRPV